RAETPLRERVPRSLAQKRRPTGERPHLMARESCRGSRVLPCPVLHWFAPPATTARAHPDRRERRRSAGQGARLLGFAEHRQPHRPPHEPSAAPRRQFPPPEAREAHRPPHRRETAVAPSSR